MSITAAIVAFNPEIPTLQNALEAVLPQVDSVVIFDNTEDTADALATKACLPHGIDYYWQGRNVGVAAVHNQAIAYAQAKGADYLLFLDQDSIPEPQMVEHLRCAYEALTEKDCKVAGVGPVYQDQKTGSESFFIEVGWLVSKRHWPSELPESAVVPSDTLISSGVLTAVSTFRVVGTMDEGLFVDHVDTEWFLRAAAKGFKAYGVCAAKMTHSVGDRLIKVWLGRWRTAPIHPAFRMYYIFRNSMVLYRRGYTPVRWIVFDIKRLLMMLVFFGLFMGQRTRYLTMMARGILDGWRGRTGAFEIVPEDGGLSVE
ncbi:MAG: glycosyltransferase family 2 protein [Arenicellales bacterium]|nr:glycosyltransferase family 2 protein [Arenicellales bacterium]